MQPTISFIVPTRNRETMHAGLEQNIHQFFSKYPYEILYLHQNDNKLFKRGQLCNLGFSAAKGNIIIFQDVDIRHLYKFDPMKLLQLFQQPFVAFDRITQLNETKPGHHIMLETETRLSGWGACGVFSKEQFIRSGGFSNLIFGWGAEDNIIHDRANLTRLKQCLGHVYHPQARFDENVHESQWYKNNRHFWQTDPTRDSNKDGFKQTTANTKTISINKHTRMIHVTNISVTPNFAYPDLYAQALKSDQNEQ